MPASLTKRSRSSETRKDSSAFNNNDDERGSCCSARGNSAYSKMNHGKKRRPLQKKRMFFMVKRPRINDDEIRMKIKLVEILLEEAFTTTETFPTWT